MDQTGRPWLDPQGRTADRVAALVAAMTREEKVALALGDEAAVAHLGIPPLLYTDSGSGVRDGDRATAFPVTLMLAATFDVELADAYGAAVGEEARAAGRNVLLGPAVDLVRTPLGGRAAESFGEDPHLAGVMAAAHVRAVQRQHVVAMLKHCVANNFEHGRTGFGPIPTRSPAVDVVVGERALRELYLEPVRAALLAGGALSVMGSYNRLNGSYACQSRWLLTTVLREDWGWPGFVAPDFLLAVRDDVAAANAGLDVAALGGPGGRTAEDFTSGRIPPERLDELVTRVVHAMVAGGLVDHPVGPDGTRAADDAGARRGRGTGRARRHGAPPQRGRPPARRGRAVDRRDRPRGRGRAVHARRLGRRRAVARARRHPAGGHPGARGRRHARGLRAGDARRRPPARSCRPSPSRRAPARARGCTPSTGAGTRRPGRPCAPAWSRGSTSRTRPTASRCPGARAGPAR